MKLSLKAIAASVVLATGITVGGVSAAQAEVYTPYLAYGHTVKAYWSGCNNSSYSIAYLQIHRAWGWQTRGEYYNDRGCWSRTISYYCGGMGTFTWRGRERKYFFLGGYNTQYSGERRLTCY